MSEEEKAAIDHQIPMTPALFERCIEHCAAIDVQSALNSLLTEYPEYAAEYMKKETELAAAAELPEDMAERSEIVWRKLCARIREIYGEDAI